MATRQGILDDIGRVIGNKVKGEWWRRIRLQVAIVRAGVQLDSSAVKHDGTEEPIDVPQAELVPLFKRLRRTMYDPDKGAWYVAKMLVNHAGRTEAEVFEYQEKPVFDVEPDDEEWAADFQEFPRPADQVPDWVESRWLDLAGDVVVDEKPEILRDIGRIVADGVPGDWERVRVYGARLQTTGRVLGTVVRSDGEEKDISIPGWEIFSLLDRLRRVTYDPAEGAWYVARMDVDREGRAESTFDYQEQPDLDLFEAGDEEWVQDLRAYPRPADKIPPWFDPAWVEAAGAGGGDQG